MSLLHPWAIVLGVLGVGLPVFVHWLTRPRPVRLPLSTLRFVQEVIQQRRARHKLRDWIILLLRTLAVLLLAWAFARPLLGDRPLMTGEDNGDAVRVVVLDVSQSMAAGTRGIIAMERARSVAADYFRYQPGLRSNLILAGVKPHGVLEFPSNNNAALREALSQAQPRPERLDIGAAINLAADMLSRNEKQQAARREVIVVSDFQRTNWASADFSPLPQETRIQLESVAPAGTPPNLAILYAGVSGRVQQNRDARVEVEVGNFSATPRDVTVEMKVGEATYPLKGLCPGGSRVRLSVDVNLKTAGWQSGQAKLLGVEDALGADNTRVFVVEVHPAPTYLLLTRESADPHPTSSYYLSRALDPERIQQNQETRVHLVRSDPAQLDREKVATAELILLDHPGKLPSDVIDLLVSLLRRGRAVFYVAAEPVDAVNLQRIVDVAGSDLKMPVQFAPPDTGRPRRDLFLADVRRDASPFRVFGDGLSTAIAPLRFSGGLSSRQLDHALIEDVLATYSDRSACLIATTCAQGGLAVLNADLAHSNLPTSPVFVPLLHELVDRLLHAHQNAELAVCGEPTVAYLPTDPGTSASLRLDAGDATATNLGQLVEESGNVLWRWPEVGPPGVYRVKRNNAVVYALASAISAEEGDLESVAPSVLQNRLAGGRRVHYHAAVNPEDRHDEGWTWLAVGCAACMLLELVALKMFKT